MQVLHTLPQTRTGRPHKNFLAQWEHYREAILGRMIAENAKSTSRAEIVRTLGPCVCGPFLIKLAMRAKREQFLKSELVLHARINTNGGT